MSPAFPSSSRAVRLTPIYRGKMVESPDVPSGIHREKQGVAWFCCEEEVLLKARRKTAWRVPAILSGLSKPSIRSVDLTFGGHQFLRTRRRKTIAKPIAAATKVKVPGSGTMAKLLLWFSTAQTDVPSRPQAPM